MRYLVRIYPTGLGFEEDAFDLGEIEDKDIGGEGDLDVMQYVLEFVPFDHDVKVILMEDRACVLQ